MDIFQLASFLFYFLYACIVEWSNPFGFFLRWPKKTKRMYDHQFFLQVTLRLCGSEFFCLVYYFVASPPLHHHTVFVVGNSACIMHKCTLFQLSLSISQPTVVAQSQ